MKVLAFAMPVSVMTTEELIEEWKIYQRLAAKDPDAEAPARWLEVSRELIKREKK